MMVLNTITADHWVKVTDEVYMTTDSRPGFTGVTGEGAWIMRFRALGKALTPYSHQ